jgi:hypothetical protein
MSRNRLYYDDNIELVKEGATYVVIKRKPKMNVIQRSLKEDIKLLQGKETIKSFLPRFNMVYKVFDCPSLDGKLLFFTTDGDPLRHCCGKHELYKRDFEELVNIATKEYGCKSYLYGMVRDDYAPETGYIVMSKKKQFPDMVEDSFGYRLDVETDNPNIAFHYYRPKKDFNYSTAETTIAKEYKLDEDNLLKLYVYNYNVAGDVAFIELKTWKVVPGSAYSKRD